MEAVDSEVLVDTMAGAGGQSHAGRRALRPVGEGPVGKALQVKEQHARAVAARLGLPHTGFLLRRERLHAAAQPVLSGGVLSLIGGPGSGKTAFIIDLLAELEGQRFYIALDEADRDPVHFFTYLMATFGLEAFDTTPSAPEWSALESPEDQVAELVERLVQFLGQNKYDRMILAIDDLHHVDSSPEMVLALDLLLRSVRPGWTVILSSRRELPVHADQAALGGRSVTLNGRRLRFTPGELAAWVSENWGADLPLDERRALWRLTDGWPAALVLLGQKLLAAGRPVVREDIARLIAQGRNLRTYLEKDVVAGLDESEARVMLTAGLMPRVMFPRDKRIFAVDAENAEVTLEQMVSRGLLITACGKRSYLVHPIVRGYSEREMLKSREGAELVKRVAAHLEQIGEHYHSARLYMRSGRVTEASRPLRSLALTSLNAAASFAQEEWSDLVSTEGADEELGPWLLLCKARALQQKADDGEASRLYERAIRLLSAEGDREGLLLALLSSAFVLHVQARWDESLAVLARARSVAKTAEETAEVLVAEGHVLVSLCRWDEGVEDWEKAVALVPEERRAPLLNRVFLGRSKLFYSLGHYHLAREWAERAVTAKDVRGETTRAMAMQLVAVMACLTGDYEEAERVGAETKRLAGIYRVTFIDVPVLLAEANLALGRWDYRTAVALCREAQQVAANTGDSESGLWAEVIMGDLCRCNRNPARALEHHERALEMAEGKGMTIFERTRVQAAKGLDLVLLGRISEARAILEETAQICRKRGLKTSLVPSLFYLGWIRACDGQEAEAARCLTEAMRVAEEHGHVHFFNQEARVAVPIFALCDRYGVGSFLRDKVVPLLPGRVQEHFYALAEGETYPTDCALGEPRRVLVAPAVAVEDETSEQGGESVTARIGLLTDREKEILEAVASGMSNKDVGAKFFISDKTVKTHTNHIFRKLGVNSRLQATLVFQSHQRAVAAGTARRNRRRK